MDRPLTQSPPRTSFAVPACPPARVCVIGPRSQPAVVELVERLRQDGHLWWLWTCVAGFGLGLVGWDYCRRRKNARPTRRLATFAQVMSSTRTDTPASHSATLT